MNAPHTPLTLFIIKKFYDYGHGHQSHQISNGLRKSAMFVVDMLLAEGHRAKLVEAIDGNSIDALVAQNQPTRVVLEAIWVTPAKLAELQRLWPKVKWTVRVHSEIPFLAQEGCAVSWLHQFASQGIEIAFNSEQTVDDFNVLAVSEYLPNYYPLRKPRPCKPHDPTLDVGCFGAIRPLKNQLIQAFAAIRYARQVDRILVFHMNGSRIEQSGASNLKNIEAAIKAAGFTLVLHPWLDHEDFLELVGSMDICLQVSLSESFNLVSADCVSMGVPLVGSKAISWLPEFAQADAGSAESITSAMHRAGNISVTINQHALKHYLHETIETWNHWIK